MTESSNIYDHWREMYRLEAERNCSDRTSKHLETFWRLTRTDNLVSAAVSMWRQGDFVSFESMLLYLVGLLATDRARLFNLMVDAAQKSVVHTNLPSTYGKGEVP